MRQGRVGRHVDTPGETRQRPWKVAAPADLGASSLTCLVDSLWFKFCLGSATPTNAALEKEKGPFSVH